jgi:hypothetical protein
MAAILAIAAGLYSGMITRFDVGHFDDDALYVLAARSLSMGHYVALQTPSEPRLSAPLPGFPLILSPFIAFFNVSPNGLKMISLLATLGSVVLLGALVQGWLGAGPALLAAALFALNPLGVLYSGTIMAEPIFTMLSLLSIFLFQQCLKGRGQALLVGICLGMVAICRAEGPLLALAMGLTLLMKRRWSLALPVCGAAGLIWLLARLLTASSDGYVTAWTLMWPWLLRSPWTLLQHWGHLIQACILETLLAFPFRLEGFGSIAIVCVLAGVPAIYGAFVFLRNKAVQWEVRWALALYVIFYAALHAFWIAVDPRYFLPLLPFLCGGLAQCVAELGGRSRIAKGIVVTMLLGIAASYVYQNAEGLRRARDPSAETRVPESTYTWIRQTTAGHSRFLSFRILSLYLYTHRQGYKIVPARDRDHFEYLLDQEGISHILLEPFHIEFVPGMPAPHREFWLRAEGWMKEDPHVFSPVWKNTTEKTMVYECRIPSVLHQGFVLYRTARSELDAGRTDHGLRLLRESLRLAPHLAEAQNAYGMTLWLTRHDTAGAERWLKQAIQQSPSYRLARMNLARIYEQTNRHDKAVALVAQGIGGGSL